MRHTAESQIYEQICLYVRFLIDGYNIRRNIVTILEQGFKV
jgi:hypothetical protein